MKTEIISSKLGLWVVGLSSMLVLTGIFSDVEYGAMGTAKISTDIKFSKRFDDSAKRKVASQFVNKVNLINFPYTQDNYKRILGNWLVKKYTYNFDSGEEMNVKVKMELVGNGAIRLDDDNNQIFSISYLSERNHIRLIKELDGGHEVIEAIKLINKASKSALNTIKDGYEKKSQIDNEEYVLVSSENPSRPGNNFSGSAVSGSVKIVDGNIDDLDVSINGYGFSVATTAIETGGVFNTEVNGEAVSGRVDDDGQGKKKISIFTGTIAGTVLRFVSIDHEEMNNAENVEVENELNASQVIIDNIPVTSRDMTEINQLTDSNEAVFVPIN